jgi:hypothetical protein
LREIFSLLSVYDFASESHQYGHAGNPATPPEIGRETVKQTEREEKEREKDASKGR